MGFEDHFSTKAASYARHRPRYPAVLYERLADLAADRHLAWDCGTGSGQAAVALARHFDGVFATDASREQIDHASRAARVHYAIAAAERAPLRNAAVDLVTVAAAVHWFDLEAFYAEVRRVLKADGVLAVWTYLEMRVDPAVDAIVDTYIFDTLAADWPAGMRYGLAHYANLPFPLEEATFPAMSSREEWSLHDVRSFIETWSGTQRHAARCGVDPTAALWPRLVAAWGDPDRVRPVRWPLHVRVGRFRR
jgi:SAM-dependent methyltransferase